MTTIDAPFGVIVAVTVDIEHLCPVVNEIDRGSVTIGWLCDGATLELHDLAAWVKTWRHIAISHEALVDAIKTYVAAQPGITDVHASATFTTAGMTVTASA